MSSIATDQGIVHYEAYGKGKPVILLHGWLGSWGLWQDMMGVLGSSYRMYALDFWGFGESVFRQRASYAVQDFVSLVDQFMEKLGIFEAPLVGHSMGGTVSLLVAVHYPERVRKVIVVGAPIVGSSLSILLKLFGRKLIASFTYKNMWIFQSLYHILGPLYSRDHRWPEMMDRDLSRTTLESFLYSIASLRRTDLRPELGKINVPVMGMYGDRDIVVHPKQWKVLQASLPNSRIERFNHAGHFIMLDEPQRFTDKLQGFLDEV